MIDLTALAALARSLDEAVPAVDEGICRHCGERIVFKPYWLDGKQPNPPVWLHPGSGTTCDTLPEGWPDDDTWPHAEPIQKPIAEEDR